MRYRLWLVVVLVTFIVAVNPAWQPTAQAQASPLPREAFIGTLRPGTGYHSMGMGLSKVLSDKLPMRVSVRPYTGPSAWLPLMDRGRLEFGAISLNDVIWAFDGNPAFVAHRIKNVRLVARGNWLEGVMGIIVRSDSPFNKISDLRGKRVTSDFGPNLIAGMLVEAWLDSAGMTWDDVKKVPVTGVVPSATALQEGRVDGAFGAVPYSGFIQALAASVPIRALPYADASPQECARIAADKAEKIIPASEVVVFARKNAPVLKGAYCSIRHPSSLVAGASVPDEVTYQVVKTIWNNLDALAPLSPWLRGWSQKQMFWAKATVPYHPGAIRFFKEQGLWTAETEKRQQELLRKTQ